MKVRISSISTEGRTIAALRTDKIDLIAKNGDQDLTILINGARHVFQFPTQRMRDNIFKGLRDEMNSLDITSQNQNPVKNYVYRATTKFSIFYQRKALHRG